MACDEADVVGGGASGLSPGPVGPPNSLGWDVGGGQCNGSFTVARDTSSPAREVMVLSSGYGSKSAARAKLLEPVLEIMRSSLVPTPPAQAEIVLGGTSIRQSPMTGILMIWTR